MTTAAGSGRAGQVAAAALWDRLRAEGKSPAEATAQVSRTYGPPPTRTVDDQAADRQRMLREVGGAENAGARVLEQFAEIRHSLGTGTLTLADCAEIDRLLREMQAQQGAVRESLKRLRRDIADVAGVEFNIPSGGGRFYA